MSDSRAERRRLERALAVGVEFTPDELARQRKYEFRHPGKLRRHAEQYPVDVEALERESEAAA